MTALLQQRKISLTHTHQNKFNQTISESVTLMKLKSFHVLQTIFSESQFLIHFNLKQHFYINLNASKQHDFDIIIYHFKSETTDISNCINVESILFLSKLLSKTENNYWLMKLKIINLVWSIHKVRHMIKTVNSNKVMIIFTDHLIMTFIIKQIKLFTSFTDKLNLRLIQIF